jgi:3-methylfumaryl-CoA hydratase
MWAGGELTFEGVLRTGETLYRRSEIRAVEEKEGSTGRMAFVTVGHEIEGAAGRVAERQDIVYLEMPDRYRPPKAQPLPGAPLFDEAVAMGPARLFRFSAATYNAHRIHYDIDYAREVEKYPGLVVHGPMQAMLLMDAGMRHAGRRPRTFRFRGVHPMFAGYDLHLLGTPEGEGTDATRLFSGAPEGHQGMQARAEWAAP